MATISITISDSQMTVLKNALADFLKIRVKSYDEKANRTVNYSTFSPS